MTAFLTKLSMCLISRASLKASQLHSTISFPIEGFLLVLRDQKETCEMRGGGESADGSTHFLSIN